MLTASLCQCEQHRKIVTVAAYLQTDKWEDYGRRITVMQQPLERLKEWLHFARGISGCGDFLHIGADVLDGYYDDAHAVRHIRMIELADALGLRATVLGFSFRSTPGQRALAAFRSLSPGVRLCCRDPLSRDRVQRLAGRSCKLVADVAFLLQANSATKRVKAAKSWMAAQHARGRTVLGLNCNIQVLSESAGEKATLLTGVYSKALSRLLRERKDTAVMLIAHDFRGGMSDAILGETIRQSMSSEFTERCYAFLETCTPNEVKAICEDLDLVVSGRMHLAIAALGQCTPVVAFEYQQKFAGLFALFGLEGCVIPGSKVVHEGCLYAVLVDTLPRVPDLRKQVRRKLPEVERLSLANFHSVLSCAEQGVACA